jgi:hypothetical protein
MDYGARLSGDKAGALEIRNCFKLNVLRVNTHGGENVKVVLVNLFLYSCGGPTGASVPL